MKINLDAVSDDFKKILSEATFAELDTEHVYLLQVDTEEDEARRLGKALHKLGIKGLVLCGIDAQIFQLELDKQNPST
jgi:hypothetical protein